jgi:DNA repair exonuclease SbcCD ATPase subunit
MTSSTSSSISGPSAARQAGNPKNILEQIGSQHSVRDGQLGSPTQSGSPINPPTAQPQEADLAAAVQNPKVETNVKSPRLRIVRPDVETFDDRLDEAEEPDLQIVEIANHLRDRNAGLSRRESELKKRMHIWQTQVDAQLAMSAYREKSLRERESQIKNLQFELLQLQNDVIDSQLAMEEIVQQFANEDSEGKLLVALEMLRFEIRERFDYVSERWDRLHLKLEAYSKRRKNAA